MVQDIEHERIMHKLLEQQATVFKKRTYLYFADETYSYEEVNEEANRVAAGLQRLGVKKGDKIAFMMDNCPEVIFLVFGLSKLGAIAVPLNTAHKGELITYMLDHSDAQMIVVHKRYLYQVESVLPNLPKLESIVVVDQLEESEQISDVEVSATLEEEVAHEKHVLSWSEVINNNGSYQLEDVKWSDPLFILYTSGTTGPSKGVLIPHNYFYTTIERVCNEVIDIDENDRIYNCMPLFHVHAWHSGINQALYKGASVVLTKRFSASRFWYDIKRYRCTYTPIIGGVTSILYKAEPQPDDADNPLRVMLGSPTPKDIFEPFQERFGVRIIEFYGSTEIGSPVSNTLNDYKVGSCGKVHRNYEMKIVDDSGNPVEANESGEIIIRPKKSYTAMLGYYKMPEKTEEVWKDGWYYTGDYGKLDEEGYLYFVDRKKDALRRRGENISSFEVERGINSHPAVLESCAVGVKSELGEDEVMACVVLKPNHSVSAEEIVSHCQEQMAYFMVPRYIRFMDRLPKNTSLKVKKFELRKEGVTKDTWDREKAGYQLKR